MTMQVFTEDQQYLIKKGAMIYRLLKGKINEALFNNTFGSNYIISSPPGLSKSYSMQDALKLATGIDKTIIQGSPSISAYTIEIAHAKYEADMAKKPLLIVQDDCDVLFEEKNLNIAKKMFDDARVLKYGKNFRMLAPFCSEDQFESLKYWNSLNPNSPGFSVPLDNTTFVILTNKNLPSINEVEDTAINSKKHSLNTDLYAIRRRTEYKEIKMDKLELWGYVANITLNEKICEKFMPNITIDHKNQILIWAYANWDRVTERNLSLIEKMTKDIVRYPLNYLDIWNSEYLGLKQ